MIRYLLLFVLLLNINLINCKAVDKPPSYYIIDIFFDGCKDIIRSTLSPNTFDSECINIKKYCPNFNTTLGLKLSYEYGNLYTYKRYSDSKCVINDHYNIFNCTKNDLVKENSTLNGYTVQCYETTAPALPNIEGEAIEHHDNKPTVVKPKYASDSSINLDDIYANKDKSNTKSPGGLSIFNNQDADYTANSIKLNSNIFIIILIVSISISLLF